MLSLPTDRTYRALVWGLMALLLTLVIATFRDYGLSWDEEIQSQYGQAVFDYYASGFVDHRYKELFNLYIYGGMFDGLAAYFDSFTPMGIYPTRHLLNALFGLLGLWGTWRLGRLVGGPRAGFMALLLLAATPMYYGHIYNNPKDIPFAAGIVWTIYYMAKSLRLFPQVRLSLVLRLGIVYGLTLGVRVGGIMLFGYWGVALLAQAAGLYFHPSSALRVLPPRRRFAVLFNGLVRLSTPAALASYVVMLICWPWAQEAPLANPLAALKQFSNFPQDVEVLLHGTIYRSTGLPWSYVPDYLLAQAPLILLTLVAGAVLLARPLSRRLTLKGARATLLLILMMAILPVLYAVIGRPALYDAIRHFIFILPLLAILGANTMSLMLDLVRLRAVRGLLWALFGLGLLGPVLVMVRLHPYEYIYVNPLVGGLPGAYGQYELDYWGTSFKEAAEKLLAQVGAEGGVPAGKIYHVAICGPWSALMNYLPPDFEPVVANEPADFFLATTRWMCQTMRHDGQVAFTVERMGVPLSVMRDLRSSVPKAADPLMTDPLPEEGETTDTP
jgi:hypothetical protein